MTKSHLGPILVVVLAILFWLWRKQQHNKAVEKREHLESHGYVPVTMQDADPDSVSKLAGWTVRFAGGLALALMIFLIAGIAYFGVEEPIVRWIMVGTLGTIGLILLIWAFGRRRTASRR